MSNLVIKVLRDSVKEYFDRINRGGAECRLVVPGVTMRMACDLQTELVRSGLPSYLVIPVAGGLAPSEPERLIYASALTSVRQGAMIVVVAPGELASIQDSVVGAGGAVRSFSFSDEWPWVDDGIQYFGFRETFAKRLCAHWTSDKVDQGFLVELLHVLVKSTRARTDRAILLFDQILNTFSAALYPELPHIREKILFHCGIPLPQNLASLTLDQWRRTLGDLERLRADIDDAYSETGARMEVLDRADELEPDTASREKLKAFINKFFDGLSSHTDIHLAGIPTLSRCWNGNIEAWKALDVPLLWRLFDIQDPSQVFILDVTARVDRDMGYVDQTGKKVVLLEGAALHLDGTCGPIPEDKFGDFKLVAKEGQRELHSTVLVGGDNSFSFELTQDSIFRSRTGKRYLRVQLQRNGDVVREERMTVYPCDTNVPFCMVLEPGFRVLAPRDIDSEDTAERIIVDETPQLILIRRDPGPDLKIGIDGELLDVPARPDKVLQIEHPMLDPADNALGRVELRATLDGLEIGVDLEAKEYEFGEYTVERELLVRMAEGRKEKVKRLLEVFAGERLEGYSGLGGLNEATRYRSILARVMEHETHGGLPLLLDVEATATIQEPDYREWHSQVGTINAGGLTSFAMSTEGKAVLQNYRANRKLVEAAITDDFAHDPRWPKYAFIPTFVERRQSAIARHITDYLQAYVDVLEYLDEHRDAIEWGECFVLTYLDCTVHWSNKHPNPGLSLLGPWHPLVVAKRFMVQRALVASARRHRPKEETHRFHRLAYLLDRINSFRWSMALSGEGSSAELGYVSSTSDPGWLLSVQRHMFGSNFLDDVVVALRRNLGLEVGLIPAARDQMAVRYMRDFCYAYPGRRSLSVQSSPVYSSSRIVESATRLLFENEEEVTVLGEQLTGGVHLFLPDDQEVEVMPWRTPPVRIYLSNGHPRVSRDLYLLPPPRPRDMSTGRGGQVALPRGRGMHAAFCAPVKRILMGATGVPAVSADDQDLQGPTGTDLGAAFVKAAATISATLPQRPSLTWKYDLPFNLEHLWNVVPGDDADPAAFIRYVKEGDKTGQARVLWDYNMSLVGAMNSYFVLSKVPEGILTKLNGSPVFHGADVAKQLVRELGDIGVAVGSESMRSGSKALGVVGMVAATRLFMSGDRPPLRNDDLDKRGFLVSVDSFKEILGPGFEDQEMGDMKRADLLAVQLYFDRSAALLRMSYCGIECKYSATRLPTAALDSATEQAKSTYERIKSLVEIAHDESGMPERLALIAVISFGLRLSSTESPKSRELEGEILDALLGGNFKVIPPRSGTVVVATECESDNASLVKGMGWRARVAPGHWPGVDESTSLSTLRDSLSDLFGPLFEQPAGSTPPVSPQDGPSLPVSSSNSGQDKTSERSGLQEPPPTSPAIVEVAKGDQGTFSPVPSGRFQPILLGADSSGYPVFYDPQSEQKPLENYNMMITGSSGKGKTQLIKSIVCGIRDQGRSVLLLDFKNDFAGDPGFRTRAKLACRYITFDGLPYNPLIPVPLKHPGTGRLVIQASQHISGIAAVLGKTFGLGAQQEASLKDVIRECFKERGIDPSGSVNLEEGMEFPDFNDLGARLKQANPLAYNRMDPLFDLNVFPSDFRHKGFDALLAEASILDLSQIQSEPIKNAVAKIVILSAHSYFNAREHSGSLLQSFVFDEAHRVLDSDYLSRFVRECRAYGVGILLSSQNPADFPQEISASLSTKIVHGNGADRDRVRDIQKLLGPSVDEAQVAELGLFEAYVSSAHYSAMYMRTLAYPQFLVLEAVRAVRGQKAGQLEVTGLDQGRLSIPYLTELLMRMGLVEEENGAYIAADVRVRATKA